MEHAAKITTQFARSNGPTWMDGLILDVISMTNTLDWARCDASP